MTSGLMPERVFFALSTFGVPMASVDRAVAGGFAAVVHLALVLPVVVLGQVFLWAEHLSLRKLSQTGQEQQSASVVGSLGLEDSET